MTPQAVVILRQIAFQQIIQSGFEAIFLAGLSEQLLTTSNWSANQQFYAFFTQLPLQVRQKSGYLKTQFICIDFNSKYSFQKSFYIVFRVRIGEILIFDIGESYARKSFQNMSKAENFFQNQKSVLFEAAARHLTTFRKR